MPIETLDDIIEEIADRMMVYGACSAVGLKGCEAKDCTCRCGFTSSLRSRIVEACEVEGFLERRLRDTTMPETISEERLQERLRERQQTPAKPDPDCPTCHGRGEILTRDYQDCERDEPCPWCMR